MIYINKSLAEAQKEKGRVTTNDFKRLKSDTQNFIAWQEGENVFIETLLLNKAFDAAWEKFALIFAKKQKEKESIYFIL